MPLTLIAVCVVVAVAGCVIAIWVKRRKKRDLELHSLTAEALHTLLASNQVLLYDVRQPLDLLANSEMIPGATRIPPKELLENPSLIPRNKDSVVYCTCPGDETSRRVLDRAQAEHFLRMKFLKDGLAGWKAKGYPVVPYEESFHLDTRTS